MIKSCIKEDIKNKSQISNPSTSKVIYGSKTLDYIIFDTEDDIVLLGVQETPLIPFLAPGLKTTVSAEKGSYIKKHKSFQDIIDYFDIEDNEIYYLLLMRNNTNNKDTILVFSNQDDCTQFQLILTSISLSTKTDILTNKLTKEIYNGRK